MKKFLPVPHSFFFEHIWKSKKKNMKEKKQFQKKVSEAES